MPVSDVNGTADKPMVLIPVGEFLMGAADTDDMGYSQAFKEETPQHAVYLDAFHIDASLVTNAAYRQFIEAAGSEEPAAWKDPERNKPNLPVVGVKWSDAHAYCQWAGMRLPTEAEWEKAARGGLEGSRYPWGSLAFDGTQASGSADKNALPPPVNSYPPNGYGLYDMVGSVWQWCFDDRRKYAVNPVRNPVGPLSEETRATRGGDWFSHAFHKRCSRRGGAFVDRPSLNIGFRCAHSIDPV